MTYIPTPLKLVALDATLESIPAPKLLKLGEPSRKLVTHPTIAHIIKNEIDLDQRPRPQMAALIQRYVARKYLGVSLDGNSKKLPDFERYKNGTEIWGMCFRDVPQSQWRLLGRFRSKDEFVGLALYQRDQLGKGKVYNEVIKGVELLWANLFPSVDFVSGASIDDYLSGPCQDLDKSIF